MGCSGLHCAALDCTGLCWAVLVCTRLNWAVLGCSRLYCGVLGCTGRIQQLFSVYSAIFGMVTNIQPTRWSQCKPALDQCEKAVFCNSNHQCLIQQFLQKKRLSVQNDWNPAKSETNWKFEYEEYVRRLIFLCIIHFLRCVQVSRNWAWECRDECVALWGDISQTDNFQTSSHTLCRFPQNFGW